jgi:hypothetical protein
MKDAVGGGDDGRAGDLHRGNARVELTLDHESLTIVRRLDLHGGVDDRPGELLGKLGPCDVGVTVGRLLAHHDEVRALLVRDRLEDRGHDPGIEVAFFRFDEDAALGALREAFADDSLGVLIVRADRNQHDFTDTRVLLGGVFGQSQGGFEAPVIERIHLPFEAFRCDGCAVGAHLELACVVRVRNALDGYEDLHTSSSN